MYDLVLIKTNKIEALDLAKKLGFDNIFFIDKSDLLKNAKNLSYNKLNIVVGGFDELNRSILSNRNVDVLLNPEPNTPDSIDQVNSGLNQVLCMLAQKNNIKIAFSIDRLSDLNIVKKIIQNIRLCRKFKVKILFFTLADNKYELRSAYDLIALLQGLGMTPSEAKYALTGISELIKKKSL